MTTFGAEAGDSVNKLSPEMLGLLDVKASCGFGITSTALSGVIAIFYFNQIFSSSLLVGFDAVWGC